MPNKTDHLNQAIHNTKFLSTFDRNEYNDWAATVLFYIGLHYIDAFLAAQPLPLYPGSHDRRDKCVREISELRQISGDYWALKNSSRSARYNPPVHFTPQHIGRLEMVHLTKIRATLQPFI